MTEATLPAALPAGAGAHSPQRAMLGLAGIFLAAMLAGLNNRVGAIALPDVRGALGFGLDDASWLTTVYSVGELIAMPFSAWFAITFSVRRFELWMIAVCTLLALLAPFVRNLELLLALRFVQGVASGTMIPVLMMAALKFLPPNIRLHGLALYALTATFAPNVSIWLAGYWSDGLYDWRWIYWQVIPLAALAAWLVAIGLPSEPVQRDRFAQANWPGMLCGVPGFALLAITLDQGIRLDWFNSPLIVTTGVAGLALLALYLLTEWYHPAPFIKLQILGRRNLGLGFSLFVVLLVVMTSGTLLPMNYLAAIQGYRPAQMAQIGLSIALPQLVLGSLVAVLLYRKWVDARLVFAGGLLLIATACFIGAHLDASWNRDQFVLQQALQALGQPMAVVAMLFLCTSVVQPHEGPFVSGNINTLRAVGSLLGGAVVGQLIVVRQRFHSDMLLDQAGLSAGTHPLAFDPTQLMAYTGAQSLVLSVADAYRVLGALALLMVPFVLSMTFIPAPDLSGKKAAGSGA